MVLCNLQSDRRHAKFQFSIIFLAATAGCGAAERSVLATAVATCTAESTAAAVGVAETEPVLAVKTLRDALVAVDSTHASAVSDYEPMTQSAMSPCLQSLTLAVTGAAVRSFGASVARPSDGVLFDMLTAVVGCVALLTSSAYRGPDISVAVAAREVLSSIVFASLAKAAPNTTVVKATTPNNTITLLLAGGRNSSDDNVTATFPDGAAATLSPTMLRWVPPPGHGGALTALLSVTLPTSEAGRTLRSRAAGFVVHQSSQLYPSPVNQAVVLPIVDTVVNGVDPGGLFGGAAVAVLRFVAPTTVAATAGGGISGASRCTMYTDATVGWSPDGCVTATTDTAPHVVECRCSRTGAVALLVDNAIDQSPPTTESADDARLLAVPALIGSIVSAVCATVVLWLHLLGDPQDAELPTRVVVHMVGCYSVALLLLVASIMHANMSMVGMSRSDDNVCVALGALLHYFLLSAYCWMGIEGQIMYQVFVVVFIRTSHEGDSRRLRRYAVFGYGFPAMVVVVMLGVFPNEYGNHGSGVCWLSRSYTGGIWAFAVPALLITAVNTIVFHKILRHLRTVLDAAASDKRVKTWVSATFSTVMGGTWLFAIIMLFTDGTVRTVITVIFTVLNGYCGVFIFAFLGGRDRQLWSRARHRLSAWSCRRTSASKYGTQRVPRDRERSTWQAVNQPPRLPLDRGTLSKTAAKTRADVAIPVKSLDDTTDATIAPSTREHRAEKTHPDPGELGASADWEADGEGGSGGGFISPESTVCLATAVRPPTLALVLNEDEGQTIAGYAPRLRCTEI
eukprot:m.77923 g.77923  ORF g.77923 m.77923 type:complete len:794 (+) comp19153_c0_seq2:110-2491(+)